MRRLEFDPKFRSQAAKWAPFATILLVGWLSLLLALVLVMLFITYWIESIPWIVTCAAISFGAGLFYVMLMGLSHQFGAMVAGALAIGLVAVFTASRKRLRMRRQRGNEKCPAQVFD